VVIFSIPEEAARAAVSDPMVMIASDGMPLTGAKVHPRGQATFSRVLGRYVREEKALDLMTALRQLKPQLGRDHATAAIGWIACNTDFQTTKHEEFDGNRRRKIQGLTSWRKG
jgi:N-acyl-D-aspartate/D-glutamate deacylase